MHYQSMGPSFRIGLVILVVFAVSLPVLFTPDLQGRSDEPVVVEEFEAENTVVASQLPTTRTVEASHYAEVDLRQAADVFGDLMGVIEERRRSSSEQVEAKSQVAQEVGHYRVERGDTLYWIARTYDTTVSELKRINNLNGAAIQPGQVILVPTRTLQHYPAGISLTNGEVQWLAQMIHAEARGEPYLGQVAVGAVILNRIKSPQFPNTLRGVLYQPRAFQPVANGSFYRPANDMAYRAALEALNGHDPSKGSLFFFNPRQSSDRFMHARPAAVTIGQHRFMR